MFPEEIDFEIRVARICVRPGFMLKNMWQEGLLMGSTQISRQGKLIFPVRRSARKFVCCVIGTVVLEMMRRGTLNVLNLSKPCIESFRNHWVATYICLVMAVVWGERYNTIILLTLICCKNFAESKEYLC